MDTYSWLKIQLVYLDCNRVQILIWAVLCKEGTHGEKYQNWLLSSPELKAQVSFSDNFLSVVCPSVCLSVNFSHFHLLLQNHWAHFNQNWHNASLGEADSFSSNEGPQPFPKGDNYEIAKIHWRNFKKIFFSRSTGPISTKLGTYILGWRGFKFVQMKGPSLFQGEIITK